MYYGQVFNKSGKPLCGLRVSDGKNISVTDNEGYYSLPGWERAHVISVQVLTESHDDYYYYINEEKFKYDFYISPYIPKRDHVSFLHFSDTEIFIDGATPDEWFEFVMSKKDECSPDFIIHTGDICRKAGLLEHYKALNSTKAGVPVRYTLGNHDYVDDRYGEYTFERYYGPLWYSFDLCGVHFVCLPISSGEVKGLYEKADAYRWLENDLKYKKGSDSLVIFAHTYLEDSPTDFTLRFDGKTLPLREEGLLAWVFGHMHVNFVNEVDGIFNVASGRPDLGGIDSTPASVRYLEITEGQLKTEVHYNEAPCSKSGAVSLGEKTCFTAPVFADGDIFVASFDDGYPKKQGIYRIGGNGETVWKYDNFGTVKYGIAYSNGRVYAVDTRGYLLAIDSVTGALEWKSAIYHSGIDYIPSKITFRNEFVVVSSGDGLCFFDKLSGEMIRRIALPEKDSHSISAPLFIGGRIYFGRHWDAFYIIDEESGKVIRRIEEIKDAIATPIAVGDKIFVPTRYSVVCIDLNGNIIHSGEKYAECAFASVGTPAYKDGVLYFGTTFCGVIALEEKTLKELHRFECGSSLVAVCSYTGRNGRVALGDIITVGDELIYGSADGCVYYYDLNTYKLNKRVEVGSPLLSGL